MSPASCPRRHTTKTGGLWVRGDDETPGLVICGNGVQQVKLRCNHCGHKSSPLPYKLVHSWRIERTDIGWTQTNTPYTYPPCVVLGCGAVPTELHHFAPRNTFGADEADRWPVLPLCPPHHREWHTRMDGYRRNAPGAAA